MADNFSTALRLVLIDEGGNDDDPRDHGGRTSRGITQSNYDSWCDLNNKPKGDVWKATDQEISDIYRSQYWEPYCPSLPTGIDYLFFDISVNCGRTQAVRQFQKALGVKVDGMLGNSTRSALISQATLDTPSLIKRISDQRRAFYRALKQFPIFGKGWLNRVNHAEKSALAMAKNKAFVKTPAPSAPAKDEKPATVNTGVSTATTVSIITVLASFKEQLEALSSSIPNLNYVILAIAVFGLGYTLYGMWKNRKTQEAI